MEIKLITAQMALDMLEKNKKNRTVSRANVDFIAEEIKSGRFIFNGDSIVFDDEGNLIDGQHRLIAIAETGIPTKQIIVHGVKNAAFSTIDTGRTRTAGDVLSIDGTKNALNLAASIRKIIEKFGQDRRIFSSGGARISNESVREFYMHHKEELGDKIEFCHHLYNTEYKIISVSAATAMYFLLSREKHGEMAKGFIRQLFNGKDEHVDATVFSLRKKLINYKIDGKKLNDNDLRNYFLYTFRAYSENKNLQRISINGESFFQITSKDK